MTPAHPPDPVTTQSRGTLPALPLSPAHPSHPRSHSPDADTDNRGSPALAPQPEPPPICPAANVAFCKDNRVPPVLKTSPHCLWETSRALGPAPRPPEVAGYAGEGVNPGTKPSGSVPAPPPARPGVSEQTLYLGFPSRK